MADNDGRERLAPEITTEYNSIEEDELQLSLGLHPINPRPRLIFTSHNFPQFSDSNPSPNLPASVSKRDAQAFRRQEAKKKRDLKRKATVERERNSGQSPPADDVDECCKAQKLSPSRSAAPPWWSWHTAVGGDGGFRPYQGQNGKSTPGAQNVVEGKERQSISSGSSSGLSDNYQSSSGPGGTSSDVGSHSSNPHSQSSPPSLATASTPSSEFRANGSILTHSPPPGLCNTSSDQMESIMSLRQPSKSPERGAPTSSITILRSQSLVNNGASYDKGCIPKEVKTETHKPPKPTGQTDQQKHELAQMPSVSVTGNGPNGKTITGLLYRYTKAEVSIVCVCHGTSFSPAGFVEHAGGVGVEHPLRHIRVVPSAHF